MPSRSPVSASGSRQRTRRQSRVNRTSAGSRLPSSRRITQICTYSFRTASGTYRSRRNSHCRLSSPLPMISEHLCRQSYTFLAASTPVSPVLPLYRRFHSFVASSIGRPEPPLIRPSRNVSPPSAPLPIFLPTFLIPSPFREWLSIRSPEFLNQFPNPGSPCQQFFHQRLHLAQVAPIPFRRYFIGRLPNRIGRHGLHPCEPWLKRFPSCNSAVNLIAVVDAPQRRVLKPPLTRVKAIPEIDKHRPVAFFSLFPSKDSLAPIRISRPLIERERSEE